MNELGAISSYALATEQLQLNIIKQQAQTTQMIAEVLLDPDRMVSISSDKGTNIDISI